MPIVIAFMLAFSVVIGGCVLAIVAVVAILKWRSSSADIAAHRRAAAAPRPPVQL